MTLEEANEIIKRMSLVIDKTPIKYKKFVTKYLSLANKRLLNFNHPGVVGILMEFENKFENKFGGIIP